jgi:HIV Tat-specific factor 1
MATREPFPTTIEHFNSDPRVSFSRQDGKYILEDHDGSEWEWEESLGKWTASVDEKLLEQQQRAYAVAGVDESESAEASIKKRKLEDGANNSGNKKAKNDRPKKERINTAVYVTSLPLDVTVEEVHEVFSKYGIIAEEVDSGKPRIKLYTDATGNPKGDALVVYFRPESVALAVQMLDDYDFRLGETGPDGRMRVKAAEYSYKKQQDTPGNAPGQQVNMKDKKKVIKKTQKLNNKLADWDDDDPQPQATITSRWDKMVILKHMFTQEELKADEDAKQEITDDIREECSKLGSVANVTLFDEETDGVVSVRFTTTEAADACVQLMNGRHFGGLKVEAEIADGTEKFKKSRNKKSKDDKEEEELKRLDEFGEWLEKGEDEAT